MKYIEENLMPNEVILEVAQVHWFVFVRPVVLLVFGFLIGNAIGSPYRLALLMPALFDGVRSFLLVQTTELGLTSKRIVAKFGWIRRDTVELNHRQFESLGIHQGIFGRMFGFGTVIINGTGGVKTPIPSIKAPLEFRRKVLETIDKE